MCACTIFSAVGVVFFCFCIRCAAILEISKETLMELEYSEIKGYLSSLPELDMHRVASLPHPFCHRNKGVACPPPLSLTTPSLVSPQVIIQAINLREEIKSRDLL